MSLKRQFQTFGQHQTKISQSLDDISGQLQSCSDIQNLVAGIQNSLVISEGALEEMNHHAILQALRPVSAGTRFDEIHDPDADTFEWIFQDPQKLVKLEPKLECSLPDWLRNGSGVFHIAGKPGSGKSTLLKFIAQHPETQSLLEDWAQQAGKQLIRSKFFFWKMGSVEQRTLKGMIRGLVYDVTRHYPAMAKVLFPKHWNPHVFLSSFSHSREIKFDESDIKIAFDTLVSSPEIFDRFRICIFLDGLDEFDEKERSHWELATTLLKWTTDPTDRSKDATNIKLCVSSRELPSLLTSFPERQRITLHNLTLSDITDLIQTKLGENPHFRVLAGSNPGKGKALLKQIAAQSSGVFLWVVLLLKLLVEELASGVSSLSALERIVESSLGELDDFFDVILNSIPRQERKQAYVVFAIILRCGGLHLTKDDEDTHIFDANSYFKVSLFGLSYLFEDFDRAIQDVPSQRNLFGINATPCQAVEYNETRIRKASIDLKSRCRGLVDIQHSTLKIGSEHIAWATAMLIHRSVAEFLLDKLRSESHDLGFTDNTISQYFLRIFLCELTLLFYPADLQAWWVHDRALAVLRLIRSRPIVSREILQLLDEVDMAVRKDYRRLTPAPGPVLGDVLLLLDGIVPSGFTLDHCACHFTTLAALMGHYEFLAWKVDQDLLFKNDRERLSGVLLAALIVLNRFDKQGQIELSAAIEILNIVLGSAILPAQLLDHIFPVPKSPSVRGEKFTDVNVIEWLDSFDHQIPPPPGHEAYNADFGLTVRNHVPRTSPWRNFLIHFFQVIALSKRSQAAEQLWHCLGYWLDVGVPTPITVFAGFHPLADATVSCESPASDWLRTAPEDHDTPRGTTFILGFRLHEYSHQHQGEESQMTRVQFTPGRDANRLLWGEYARLIEHLMLFGHDEVRNATFESFIRYHRPPNMDRLLEHIGRQTPLHGGDGSDPDSIWDLQRIVEEAPNSLSYPN